MPTCGLTDYGPAMGTTHDICILELNPAVVSDSVFHQLVPHWSPISCVFPFVGRLGPARAKVGLGFAVVGWFKRFCPSPPSAGLGPFPSASAFLFPCPFGVCPLRARCVGWCWLQPTKTVIDRSVNVPARTLVVHLGAFKSQLVATIFLYIVYIFNTYEYLQYIYIYV